MRRWWGLVSGVAALALLGACDEGPEAPPDPCAARLAALGQRLSEAATLADPPSAPPDVQPPRLVGEGLPWPHERPLIVVTADEVRFDERGVGGLEDLDRAAETLTRDLRAAARVAPTDELGVVGLWVAPEVEVTTLERLLRHAPPGVTFALLARGPAPAPPRDTPAWVGETLRGPRLEPAFDRRRRIELAWRRATQACEGAEAELTFGVALDPAGTPAGAPSTRGLVAALGACGCDQLEMGAVEAIALAALAPGEGGIRRMPPTLRFGAATGDGEERTVDGTVDALIASLAEAPPALVWIRAD